MQRADSTALRDSNLFDEPAVWRATAAQHLGLTGIDLMAAASPGASFPAALRSLVAALRLTAGERLVDVGGGLGGAASWIRDKTGCCVVVAEPAPASAAMAVALFPELQVIRCAGAALPVADGTADAVVLLGVTSLLCDLDAVLAECVRVLRSGGHLGITDLCSRDLPVERSGTNTFRSLRQLMLEVRTAGLVPSALAVGEPDPAPAWREINERVVAHMRHFHNLDPTFPDWDCDQRHLRRAVSAGRLEVGSVAAIRP